MWKHRNVLPCLGNVVCWHIAPQTMLPGRGSTFLLPTRRRQSCLSPTHTPISSPSLQRHGKCQNTRWFNNHSRVSSLLRHPSNSAPGGTNSEDPNATHATGDRRKNAQTPWASPECASALPGDVGNDRVHICTRSRWRPSPGSPMGLPGEFHLAGWSAKVRYSDAAHFF